MKFRFKNAPNMSVKTRLILCKSLRIAGTIAGAGAAGIFGTIIGLVGFCAYKAFMG